MKNTPSKILKACEKSYSKSGVQAAINTATSLGVKSYHHCSPCEASQPSVVNTCCVCGSANK